MMFKMNITCSRCGRRVAEAAKACNGVTCGYYEVARGAWARYANPGEEYLCDPCMFQDPRYIDVYGRHS